MLTILYYLYLKQIQINFIIYHVIDVAATDAMQARRSASGSEARRASWNSEQVAEGAGRAVRPVEAQRSDTAEGAAAARRVGRGGRGVGLLRAGARGAFFWGGRNWRGFSLWLVGCVFSF